MATVGLPAHAFEEIEDIIEPEYGVKVRMDLSDAPWNTVFEGPREGLERMIRAHWGDDAEESITYIED